MGSHTGETKAWHKLTRFFFISEVAMKPLQSSLTFFLPSKGFLFKTTSSTFPPTLAKFTAAHLPRIWALSLSSPSRAAASIARNGRNWKLLLLKITALRSPKGLWADLHVYLFLWLLHIRGIFGWLELSSFSCAPSLLGCFLWALPPQWFLTKYMKVFSTLLHRTEVVPAKNHHSLGRALITHY